MIPRIAHFVFGLREQSEPFHFLHYVSVESCRRILEPEAIYFHHKHLPWGPWWERIRPHLTLREVDLIEDVTDAHYLEERIPARYRYAHHADFVRLDALIEHGGIYADIDTIFLRPFPEELFEEPFVIGREPAVRDERTGESRLSLCNALMMAGAGAAFAGIWRAKMASALDGTWSNHSGFLPERLSRELPNEVRVEPEARFFAFPPSRAGLSRLLQESVALPASALSVHLWAHLWWDRRGDFTPAHAGWGEPSFIRRACTTLGEMVRPYLPEVADAAPRARRRKTASPGSPVQSAGRWAYLSLDEDSGYGVAARRCITALDQAGIQLQWIPFIAGRGWRLGYEPGLQLPARESDGEREGPDVLVAHLVPEYLPPLRRRASDSFLVAHTVWDSDRIPDHWVPCLNQADLIVVPSSFSAEAIHRSPVSTAVEVVPHVAPSLDDASPVTCAYAPDDVFVFYTIGEWNERKGISNTLEAYLRAFSARDPVLLIIKTTSRDSRRRTLSRGVAGEGTTTWAVAHHLARHPEPPAVCLITRPFTDVEIAALHRRGDCYVSLCRSEGFGLGPFDAAAHGNPVVITGFGGQLDYLSSSPYRVRFDLVPVLDPAGFPSYASDQIWAEPDVDHAADLLREVVADPREAAARSEPIAASIRRRYRPQAIAEAFVTAVEQHRVRRARPRTAAVADRD